MSLKNCQHGPVRLLDTGSLRSRSPQRSRHEHSEYLLGLFSLRGSIHIYKGYTAELARLEKMSSRDGVCGYDLGGMAE